MKDIQRSVDMWVRQCKIGYFEPLECIARIAEEVGELSREVSHRYGSKKRKDTDDTADLEEELGDVIFSLTCLANSLNLDMDRGFKHVMNKLNTRDKDRWERK